MKPHLLLTLTLLCLACAREPDALRPDAGEDAAADAGPSPDVAPDAGDGGEEDAGTRPCMAAPTTIVLPRQPPLSVEPSEKWRVRFDRRTFAPGLAWESQTAYVASGSRLIAVRDGQTLWERTSPSYEPLSGPVVLPDGSIATSGNELLVFAPSGNPRWRRATGEANGGQFPPVFVRDRIVVATSARELVSFTADGHELWRTPTAGRWGGPAVLLGAVGDELILLEDAGNRIVDADTGRTSFRIPAAEAREIGFRVAGPGWGLAFSRNDPSSGQYVKQNTEVYDFCGASRWTLPFNNDALLLGPDDHLVTRYIDDSGATPSLRTSTWDKSGKLLGTLEDGGLPLAVGADGTLYLARCPASGGSELVAVDTSSVTEMWRLPLDASLCATGHATLDADGTLVVTVAGTSDAALVAYQTRSPGPGGAWPLRHRDNRGTGWLP